jgi:trigger factor
MVLLCPTHHAEKTRGILPDEVIRGFMLNPTAIQLGRTSVTRPFFKHIPSLALGGAVVIHNTPIPVMVHGTSLIEFLPPEPGSDISRINASITSDNGQRSLTIVENEWIVQTGVWDYEWVGQRMTIRDEAHTIVLQITVHPPKLIEIDRLRFNRDGFDVTATRTQLRINGLTLFDCIVSNCRVGFDLGGYGGGAAISMA